MDDQSMAEGAGLLAELGILDAAPTTVVTRGNYVRWIGNGDWGHFAVGERR